MRYIPLSSQFKNQPALNAPLCNFICSCMGGLGLDSFLLLESNWKQFCIRVPRFVIGHRAESRDFPLKTPRSKWGWCLLVLSSVWSLPAPLANPPPREGATATWISMCVLTFLLHCSRRSISELWQRRGQAKLGERWGEERRGEGAGEEGEEEEERPVRINAGEDKILKLACRGLAVNNQGNQSLDTEDGATGLVRGTDTWLGTESLSYWLDKGKRSRADGLPIKISWREKNLSRNPALTFLHAPAPAQNSLVSYPRQKGFILAPKNGPC